MKIAIVGGGIVGLVSAYHLSQKGHSVTLFEKEKICGGLASGFKAHDWGWYLDRTYHHIFSNDHDVLQFSDQIGFRSFVFAAPQTASLYNSRIFSVDTPQDFLHIPFLRVSEKLRAGIVIAFLKYSPFLSLYEKETAQAFLRKTMGDRAWVVLWEDLFRKKFGKYAEKIVASFIWSRIKKRTKRLGYPNGGFQHLVNHIVNTDIKQGVDIKNNSQVIQIQKKAKTLTVSYLESKVGGCQKQSFEAVIFTLSTPILTQIGGELFDRLYIDRLKKIHHLFAINLILETENPILKKTYWLNVCERKNPIMCVVQHTNLVEKKNYAGNHIAYVANYVERNDWRLRAPKEQIIKEYLPHLKSINSQFSIINSFLFTFPYAQPIYDNVFVTNRPSLISPVKNVYIANLEMTYPYDRGINCAVKLGKQVAGVI